MSNENTINLLPLYEQMSTPTLFLSGFFQTTSASFHSSETVEIDVIRTDEEVSVAIQDLTVGYRMNATDIYTNKNFKPPIHKEAIALNSTDLIKRMPGQNPFQQPDFRANVIAKLFTGMTKVEAKIKRAMEWQASQVLQTGVVTLVDGSGNTVYTIDYKPKSSHFPTVGTSWGSVGADPLADINSVAEVIRNDGLDDPDQLIMGSTAFIEFLKDDSVQAHYDNRRIDQGTISNMQMRGNGGNFRGVVEVGNYRYDIWTYGGRFNHPQTGTKTQFLDTDKVIVRASSGRMDASFGAIPNIGAELGITGAALVPELPSRLSSTERNIDLFTNIWLSQDGEQLFGGVGSRPLMIPVAIDTYGCIDTTT